jgi:plasmid stabilization system protein ParE
MRLDEICRFTGDQWGETQAKAYITGLFDAFKKIESRGLTSRSVPAEFGGDGYFFRYERHFVHWRRFGNGDIGIVTILHERLHPIDRFKDAVA